MAAPDEVTDWRKLREFADVDLCKSFVLSWSFQEGVLFVDLDLYLLPDHPYYEVPRPAEKVCIRPAIIEFPYCERINESVRAEGASLAMLAASLDTGAISGLRRLSDGRYEVTGEFGRVEIEAERPLLRLKSP